MEVIREVPTEKPLRRTRSSVDLSRTEVKSAMQHHKDKMSVLGGLEDAVTPPERPSSAIDTDKVNTELDEDDETEMAIEWLMVTRSDPGGSVPRFMVEKGTPGGISNDANKFIRWLSSTSIEELLGDGSKKTVDIETNWKEKGEEVGLMAGTKPSQDAGTGEKGGQATPAGRTEQTRPPRALQTSISAPQGFYGMISGALGAATSVVANTIGVFTGSAKGTDSELNTDSSEGEDKTDTDSEGEDGYVSAEDWADNNASVPKPTVGGDQASTRSTRSTTLSSTTSSALQTTPPSITTSTTGRKRGGRTTSQHEKDLLKLQEHKKKAEEKLARAQARRLKDATNSHKNTINSGDERDKLRERHEKELAKQEAKYQRELKKLEEKRKNEERKAEERQRKQRRKEEKANTGMELERVKAERDLAMKEIEVLKDQVGDLQGQNTKLVAILGKHGLLPDAGSLAANGSRGSSVASLEVEG